MLNKITPLLQKTAEATGYPPEQVASVMAFYFDTLKNYTLLPKSAGFRLPYIGVVRTKIKVLNFYLLRDGIKLLKQGKLSKERFANYWKLRTIMRKDDERRDFKTRFNLTFNPSWRQGDGPIERDSGSY